jgi:UDP-N-acetylmuramoylalanine--D-glutamate ligase
VSSRFPTTDPWLREALGAAERRGAQVLSEVDLFMRLTSARLAGVTGTKGKTTAASVLAAMLAEGGLPTALGGNIGTPLIERSLELGPDDWVVLELSELQLPTISRGVDVALYTNIAEDHLDRHGTVEAYRAVKALLAELTVPDGQVVINQDDPGSRELGERLPSAALAWYGMDRPGRGALEAWLEDGWVMVGGERVVSAEEVRLPGRHMLADVLGAALAARLIGVEASAIATVARTFAGVPHRLETVAEQNGVRWINDSQATIPQAAIAALEAFDDSPIVLIAGGKDKGLDYAAFADAIASHVRALVLIGETADELERLVVNRVPVRRASSMDEAVAVAAEIVKAGDIALLSPAAASFDMFVDYAARGDAFRAAVERTEKSR